uniref:Translin-associated factor X-interacting protein 1 n=1 Tax=Phallusia mammillata TaxID=59560 RepID=A0A6F9DWC0_9ASCI|nr:translin-associated factor X-interacting protein 1 [Phallusia mammillata]
MSIKPPKLPPIQSGPNRSDTTTQVMSQADKMKSVTSYTLAGDSTKHVLPRQSNLRPGQDTKSGEIETWPAYASRSMLNAGISSSSMQDDKVVTKVEKAISHKPKFLAALENYVKKEIVQLNCTDPKPSELRLQAYREVFEYLIEDFKTYKPLLSQIKNEYEKMLSHHRQKIRELEPLKSMLITVSEQCDQKILKIREQERQEIITLRQNKLELLKYIDSMRENEKSLQAQVGKLQEELAEEYRRYRNECDMRKLLISDMNDLRHQQEDLKRAAGQGSVDADDDPVRLKLSLQVAREDLTRQAEQLTRMQADYGDVVPRRDFEMLEAKHAELNEKHEQLQSDFKQLKDEHETILDVHKQVMDQRDEFYTEMENLRETATPRPTWELCSDAIPAGPDHWAEVTSGKRSQQILEALLKEFKSGGSQGPDTFEGKGTGDDVPKFLRYEGDIRNRKMRKSELSTLLKEIWAKKVQSDAALGSRQEMTEFLHTFFLGKFNNMEDMASEWGYSLYDALNKYKEEPQVEVFLNVILGEGTEDLYYRQMDLIQKVMEELKKADTESTGKVGLEQFNATLVSSFTLKNDVSINALLKAAAEELEVSLEDDPVLDYMVLFTEDEEGHTGPFLNTIRIQEAEERETYISQLSEQLEAEQVSSSELRSTFMMIDPAIESAQMTSYLQIAFKAAITELDDLEPVDKEIVLNRLRKGGVHRVGMVY